MLDTIHTQLPVVKPVVKSFPAAETPSFPSDAMLRDFRGGEVLVIYSRKSVSVFSLEKTFASVVARFFRVIRKDDKAVFLVGGISGKGGLFRSISRNEAIGKITQAAFNGIGKTGRTA